MATRKDTVRRDPEKRPGGGAGTRARAGSAATSRSRRVSPVLAIVLVLLAAFGVIRSVEPFREYREVTRERAALEAQVALVEQENTAVRSEIAHLEHDSYLEALARSELSLARPGEDVFIVTGLPTTTTGTVVERSSVEPGPLEKMVGSLRSLF